MKLARLSERVNKKTDSIMALSQKITYFEICDKTFKVVETEKIYSYARNYDIEKKIEIQECEIPEKAKIEEEKIFFKFVNNELFYNENLLTFEEFCQLFFNKKINRIEEKQDDLDILMGVEKYSYQLN